MTLVAQLNNQELISSTQKLVSVLNENTASLLEHLAEIDTRMVHREMGYSSMFAYCTQALGLSEGSAYKRMQAACVIRKYPDILLHIANGRINLTGVCVLAPILTEDNYKTLIQQACGRSKRDIERIRAEHEKTQAPANYVRKTVVLNHAVVPLRDNLTQKFQETLLSRDETFKTTIKPVCEQRYTIRVTLSKEAFENLQQLQEMLSHTGTTDEATIISKALELAVVSVKKTKAITKGKSMQTPSSDTEQSVPVSRAIPRKIKHAVLSRDKSQCTFVSETGHRCTEKRFLELHHINPYARGGTHSIKNICLMCKAHNQWMAVKDYGMSHMNQYIKNRSAISG